MDVTTTSSITKSGRKVNVRPDTLDFRDLMFVPTLVEVPTVVDLQEYRKYSVPILDQGNEGACTGFGLATVVHSLLHSRKVFPDQTSVSPWMFYQLAKRYDEWSGEEYEGSSARGAMKGWHKHGVCQNKLWPTKDQRLNPQIAADAILRPLGAYFRVNHKDLVAMHCALAEVGILYATATVHDGWDEVDTDGLIRLDDTIRGGHAFAIVAYDKNGFWIQNSWGKTWGKDGFAHISYEDWLINGTDVWVARLGVPVSMQKTIIVPVHRPSVISHTNVLDIHELRKHIISTGNDGILKPGGVYGTSQEDVEHIFMDYFPSVTEKWKKKRILLYAHGGVVDENTAVQRLSEYLPLLIKNEVYPVFFIWHSDFWSTLINILKDAIRRRRPEGFLDDARDFLLDRIDDTLEPIARTIGGKSVWDEMKENAEGATTNEQGGARIALAYLEQILKKDPSIEVHLLGHSAGSILHAKLIEHFTINYNRSFASCTLWAPACTMKLFKETYLPAISNNKIGLFRLFTLDDKTEQDDNCGRIYNKSLLYMVSNAFEEKPHIPLYTDGEPLLGMQKFIKKDTQVADLFNNNKTCEWIISPNDFADPTKHSTARHHGDFNKDEATVKATIARIIGVSEISDKYFYKHSSSSLRERRLRLQA